jgi:hypothetical protein
MVAVDVPSVRTVVAEVERHRIAAESVVVDVPAALVAVVAADTPQLPEVAAVVGTDAVNFHP